MVRTVLVTGADGFLGTAVLGKLRESHGEVVPVTRRTTATNGSVFCDLGHPDAVISLLRETKPECVVNLAARVDFSRGVLASLYPVNSLCPAIFADYCQKHNAYLVQASGIIVQGFENTHFGQNTPTNPDTDYGISKLLAERAIIASGCSAANVRFSGIFGVNGPEHLGINRAIKQAKSGIVPKVVGSGAAKRNYVYVEDAAAMVEKCIADQLTGVFIAGGETRSIREMLQSICDVWLPGQSPITVAGEESRDQLVEVSPELDSFRPFIEGTQDCR